MGLEPVTSALPVRYSIKASSFFRKLLLDGTDKAGWR